jgi:hypothetical protein
MSEELKVIQKAYDLCLYLVPLVNKFPRDYKFTLGDRITNAALDIYESLVAARYTKDRGDILRRVNLRLDRTRGLLRMARDLDIFPLKSVEHSAGLLNEVGGLVGSWLKKT